MQQYHSLLKEIISQGDVGFEPRTQMHTIGISGALRTYDLGNGFPLLTTKQMYMKLAAEELFWKLRGEHSVKILMDRGVNYWNKNAFDFYLRRHNLTERFPKHTAQWNEKFREYEEQLKANPGFAQEGTLGEVYGYQWLHGFIRKGEEINQLEKVIAGLKDKGKRGSRYHILNAWNTAAIPDMALAPCPFWHQFTATDDGYLDLTVAQRSCDTYLGVPYNIAQDSLFLEMMAKETGMTPRFLRHITINTHIYLGVEPRTIFWKSPDAVREFKRKFREAKRGEEFLEFREWYLKEAGPESKGNERKDHMPFVLEQLSKNKRKLPRVELAGDMNLYDALEAPTAPSTYKLHRYNPHKWDSKAEMAA